MKRLQIFKLTASLILCFFLGLSASAHETAVDGEAVPVPALMYHSVCSRGSNQWTISPAAFEDDLRYLSQNGWHSVGVSDLAGYVYDGEPLPEKSVMITFDDGCYNTLTQALPLLEKYDMNIVLSIIGDATEKWSTTDETSEKYGHLSWDGINELLASGRVELSNHTQSLHSNANGRKGCVRKRGEDESSYNEFFEKDVNSLQENIWENCGVTPVCFAYPFGSKCPEALDNLKRMGFKVTLSCASGMNYLRTGDADCLYDMHRDNRSPTRSARQIIEALLKKEPQKS